MAERTLTFDNLDLDLILKVASHTVFSPFFTMFIPVIYKAGHDWSSPLVYVSTGWFALVTLIWIHGLISKSWRNPGKEDRFDWGDQVIVVTGGASGMGALLANTLAVRHCTVIVLDVNPIETENTNITLIKCDVSKWDQVQAAAKEIKEEFGDPTVLVNNAGVMQGKFLLDLSPEDVQQSFNVNVIAHFNTIRAFLPAMLKEKKGHIITMSSVMGFVGCAQASDYCATKAALLSLHDSLRQELDTKYAAPHIRTTIVTPGLVRTPMTSTIDTLSKGSPLPQWLHEFLFPPLPPHTVVKDIIAAIDTQESRDVTTPFLVHGARVMGSLPYWARDTAQWLSGANYSLNGYRKVTGIRSDETLIRGKNE